MTVIPKSSQPGDPVDLIIAAIADTAGIGVLHYDAHYDLILEQTDLRFESRWLAPRGSI